MASLPELATLPSALQPTVFYLLSEKQTAASPIQATDAIKLLPSPGGNFSCVLCSIQSSRRW